MRLLRLMTCLFVIPFAAIRLLAQQGFTQNAPIYAVNSQYVQGVAPGFWPTAGGGLVLNLASGTASCGNSTAQYAGGTLTLTASTTNYVYVDPVACLPTFNTAGFPANAVPLATVSTGASSISAVLDQRTWFSVPNVVSLVNAASFTGGSAGAQLDNGCNSLSGKPGVVVIPSTMGSGQSLAGLPNGCAVLDLRGPGSNLTSAFAPDLFGDENSNEARFLFRERIGSPQPPIPLSMQTVVVYQEPFTGGTNITGTKSNYAPFIAELVRRTPGQSESVVANASCYSQGDCEPLQGILFAFQDQNAGGDEGAIGMRVNAYQGSGANSATEFHATVSSVSGSTLNYNLIYNENTRGEKRLLLNTNSAKGDTTGTISAVSGVPPVVTGSGTKFATNHGGAGSKSSLCFELNGSAGAYNGGSNPVHDVFQVASVSSDTSLTLTAVFEGVNTAWNGDVSSGGYTLYPCSTVTSLGLTGSLNVADPTQFAANDTILMPIGHVNMSGGLIVVSQLLPAPFSTSNFTLENQSVRPLNVGLDITGNYATSPIRVDPLTSYVAPSRGIWFTGSSPAAPLAPTILEYDDGGTNNVVTALSLGRNGLSSFASFQYDKSADNWLFGGPSGAQAGINALNGTFGSGLAPQSGWQGWFQVAGSGSNGVQIAMPSNGTGSGLVVAYGGIPSLMIFGSGSNSSTWRIANGADLIGYSDNQATQTWNINSATGNASFNNLPPVYNAAGTAQTGSKLHLVADQVTLASGSATVTLASSAAFTSSSSFRCTATDQTGANAVKVANSSGTQFTVTGTGSDSISFICVGT